MLKTCMHLVWCGLDNMGGRKESLAVVVEGGREVVVGAGVYIGIGWGKMKFIRDSSKLTILQYLPFANITTFLMKPGQLVQSFTSKYYLTNQRLSFKEHAYILFCKMYVRRLLSPSIINLNHPKDSSF